jgi:hypothetical protein
VGSKATLLRHLASSLPSQVHPGVCSRFRRPELPDMATVVEEWPGLSDEEAVAKSRQMFNETQSSFWVLKPHPFHSIGAGHDQIIDVADIEA